MSVSPETIIAANRFGLGARPGDLEHIGSAPREWLLSQIEHPQTLPKAAREVPDSKSVLSLFFNSREMNRNMRDRGVEANTTITPEDFIKLGQQMRPVYMQHVLSRALLAIKSETPFHERLVHFWSNHFAVSTKSPQMVGLAATLEFEAIRPNITGNFSDLLFAVESHPAMITYLDNQLSIGTNSDRAKLVDRRRQANRKPGINENLAREILELHTLGVNGGYTQEDVISFAKVISGWTYGGFSRGGRFNSGPVGEFHFNQEMHESGVKTVLQKQYRQSGMDQGKAVLKDLGEHPATARHLATKLARHFIADDPPEAAINRISEAYLDSSGHLPVVYAEIVNSSEAWQLPFAKYKTPEEYVHSAYRAIKFTPDDAQQLLRPLAELGQQPFQAGSPAGWPDTTQEWSGGEALFKRIEFSNVLAVQLGNIVNPSKLAKEVLGTLLGDHTRIAIRRAERASQGIALLLASPEFLRR